MGPPDGSREGSLGAPAGDVRRTQEDDGIRARTCSRAPAGAGALLVELVELDSAALKLLRFAQKSMPPMPPMPPSPPPMAGAFSGLSATTASVVRNSAAIDAAFCSAERVTLAGSMMP